MGLGGSGTRLVTEPLRVRGTEPRSRAVRFTFDGREIVGRRGETLAAALIAAGEREFRRTRKDEPRGIFCGMGVCQECLVEIDGRPNQRACMTKLVEQVTVRRQGHLAAAVADAGAALSPVPNEVPREPEILVVGGGAGGLTAATVAARAGARVLLVDERPQAGGQYYKQPLAIEDAVAPLDDDRQFAGGRALIAAAEAAGVEILPGAQLWGAFEPLDLMVAIGGVSRLYRPKRLIVAAGAYERGLPFPGWTSPGVMTTGAAQTLLRSYRVLPGRRVLVAGNGPLNLQVALELARAGAEIVAVAELARPGASSAAAAARMLASAPGLTLKGLNHVIELRRRGIPFLRGHVVTVVERAGTDLRARVAPWPAEATAPGRDLVVDAVCLGYGFLPSNEILRALGCRHDYDDARGQLVTARDADCQTSVAGVYAVGDCTGLGGAPAAESEGTIAGMAAAHSLGHAPAAGEEQLVRGARARLARQRRFQAGLWTLFRAPRLATELTDAETVICRCEELTLGELTAELAEPRGVGTVKRLTRAGMGRCQGRYCGPIIAALSAASRGTPLEESGHWAPRPPIKPVRIGDIGD